MQKAPAVWNALPQCGAVVLTTDRDRFKSVSFLFILFFLKVLFGTNTHQVPLCGPTWGDAQSGLKCIVVSVDVP